MMSRGPFNYLQLRVCWQTWISKPAQELQRWPAPSSHREGPSAHPDYSRRHTLSALYVEVIVRGTHSPSRGTCIRTRWWVRMEPDWVWESWKTWSEKNLMWHYAKTHPKLISNWRHMTQRTNEPVPIWVMLPLAATTADNLQINRNILASPLIILLVVC